MNRPAPSRPERGAARRDRLTFALAPVPPFRLDLTAWALRRRPENDIDLWDGTTYRRVLVIDDRPVAVAVCQTGGLKDRRLHIELRGERLPPAARRSAAIVLDRMLGLRHSLRAFYRLAARDQRIEALVRQLRGMKPPRFPTVFEALVNGIACQQLTLHVGILLLSRLAQRFGPAVDGDGVVQHAFPRPVDLADLSPPALRALGFSTNKARALIAASAELANGRLDLEELAASDRHEALARLHELRGVGRWTAEYVLLRGLGRLDTFPGDDVGARNNLAGLLHRRTALDYDGVGRVVADWQPYAGLLYFHLLLDRVTRAGWLAPSSGMATRGNA
ncbi:MAG: DNA-3-methyladenine glycosylase 2 family protein [Candidatus Binatia bacterium]